MRPLIRKLYRYTHKEQAVIVVGHFLNQFGAWIETNGIMGMPITELAECDTSVVLFGVQQQSTITPLERENKTKNPIITKPFCTLQLSSGVVIVGEYLNYVNYILFGSSVVDNMSIKFRTAHMMIVEWNTTSIDELDSLSLVSYFNVASFPIKHVFPNNMIHRTAEIVEIQ